MRTIQPGSGYVAQSQALEIEIHALTELQLIEIKYDPEGKKLPPSRPACPDNGPVASPAAYRRRNETAICGDRRPPPRSRDLQTGRRRPASTGRGALSSSHPIHKSGNHRCYGDATIFSRPIMDAGRRGPGEDRDDRRATVAPRDGTESLAPLPAHSATLAGHVAPLFLAVGPVMPPRQAFEPLKKIEHRQLPHRVFSNTIVSSGAGQMGSTALISKGNM